MRVGVVGGSGSVGRGVADRLGRTATVVVAGRAPGPAAGGLVLDLDDESSVAAFCASVDVVVNCSGAPPGTRARLALSASAVGVPYIDPGGDEAVHDLLRDEAVDTAIVLSAGMWPGLTGLVTRLLGPAPGARVVCYAGGRDRFSSAGAADYLAAMNGDDRTFSVWRAGARRDAADVRALDGAVPYFHEEAAAVPYLGPELERVAADLRLGELVAYTVLPGRHLRETLAAARRGPVDASAVVRASELDLFGGWSYQRLVACLPDEGSSPAAVLTGTGSAALTAAMAAFATVAVFDGSVTPGVHFAADVLDPGPTAEALRSDEAVVELGLVESTKSPRPAEEGTL